MITHRSPANLNIPEPSTATEKGKERLEWTISWKIGRALSYSLNWFTEKGKRRLVVVILLMMANYFVFSVWEGLSNKFQTPTFPDAPTPPILKTFPTKERDKNATVIDSSYQHSVRP